MESLVVYDIAQIIVYRLPNFTIVIPILIELNDKNTIRYFSIIICV